MSMAVTAAIMAMIDRSGCCFETFGLGLGGGGGSRAIDRQFFPRSSILAPSMDEVHGKTPQQRIGNHSSTSLSRLFFASHGSLEVNPEVNPEVTCPPVIEACLPPSVCWQAMAEESVGVSVLALLS